MSPIDDEVLVLRAQNGELEAFELLVRRYQKLVFGVAYQHLSNVEDARDVSQNTFIRAFTHLESVREASRVKPWLRQIALNECHAWRAKHRAASQLEEETLVVEAFTGIENRVLVVQALQTLDELSRLTLMLFYGYAYSQQEIGDLFDEPVTTIKSRLRNAKEKLRKELGITLERKHEQHGLTQDFAARVTQIIDAVRKGDEATVLSLIKKAPELLDAREEPGNHTPLHIAASSGDAAMVELLLNHGANPNALELGDNASPLHFAAERGWIECVRLLVEAGADVNWNQDLHERGPLGWAIVFGSVQTEVTDYLISQGAKMDIFAAIGLGRKDGVERMIANDPEVVQQRMSEFEAYQTPIEFAAAKKQFEIGDLIAKHKSSLSLNEAAAMGYIEQTQTLIAEKPEIEVVNQALIQAVRSGKVETTRLLLAYGADPDYAPHGLSPMFDAVAGNDEPMARLLLEFGADLEFKDCQWKSSPLGWQVFYGRPEQVELAIRLGSKVRPEFIQLAKDGENGQLRRWSSGSPEQFRKIARMLING